MPGALGINNKRLCSLTPLSSEHRDKTSRRGNIRIGARGTILPVFRGDSFGYNGFAVENRAAARLTNQQRGSV